MKLIEKTGSKPESANSKRTKQFGIFECPVCSTHVERPLSHGKKNKTCGAKECKKAAFTNIHADTSRHRKKPILSTLPYYSSIATYHNRLMKSNYINLSDGLKDLSEFVKIAYADYATVREQFPQIPISMITIDGTNTITASNYKFIASQNEVLTEDIFVNEFEFCCRRLMHELNVSYAVVVNTIKIVTNNYKESTLISKYGTKLRTLVVSKKDYASAAMRISHNKNRSSSSYLYLVESAGHVKIGITNDVNKRLSSIRTSTPFGVSLIQSWDLGEEMVYKVEQHLHSLYSEYSVRLEWFKLSSAQIDEIIALLDNRDTVIEAILSKEKEDELNKVMAIREKHLLSISKNIATYEESKRKAREANKKPVIETVHEYGDVRFAHDRTNQIEATTTHGMVGTAIYAAWQTVKKIYGVSKEWEQFEQFMEDIGAEYATFAAEDIARVYPVDIANPVSPTNYVIKAKKDHIVQSAVARSVLQLKDGEVIAEYNSVTEAAKSVDGIASKISAVCKGNRKTHAGFGWAYKE